MNTRALTKDESANLSCLHSAGLSSALLFVTETGLKKGILDATEPMRRLLRLGEIHDYSLQGQGPENKRILPTIIHTALGPSEVLCSFYRPVTKGGDPRFWPSRFTEYAAGGDVCALFVYRGQLHLLNLSFSSLSSQFYAGLITPMSEFFLRCQRSSNAVADELLAKLRKIADAGPLEAVCPGDTAIGRSIETALGIEINSSRNPDYNGIEIKSGRSSLIGRTTRATLFACVPDWSLSRCKGSGQILEEFGYQRQDGLKLYCTVSTQGANSQGLIFSLDQVERLLRENSVKSWPQEVAVWRLSHLEERLSEKHRETFWVKALPVRRNGKECFQLKAVMHTRSPDMLQLERMLEHGSITMDHLIKQTGSRVQEKGPLFKIARNKIHELFLGEPKTYQLS